MLYALPSADIERLRRSKFVPEFTGAEMLIAAFHTDPAIVATVLPRPLRAMDTPIAVAFVARYPQTNFGVTYHEGALFIQAAFRGEVGLYCLAMPVDDDMALIGGRERLGFPKKMADRIALDTSDGKIVGSVVRKGVEILHIEGVPKSPVAKSDLDIVGLATVDEQGRACRAVISFLFKFSPSPDGRRFDYIPRLVRQVTLFRPRAGLMTCNGQVVTASSPCDPLGDIPIVGEPVICCHGVWDNTMLPGKVVARAWNMKRFLPHAFFKTDAPALLLESVRTTGSAFDNEEPRELAIAHGE